MWREDVYQCIFFSPNLQRFKKDGITIPLNPRWIPKGYISQYFLLYVLVTLMIHALNTRVLVLTIFSSFLCSGPTPPP